MEATISVSWSVLFLQGKSLRYEGPNCLEALNFGLKRKGTRVFGMSMGEIESLLDLLDSLRFSVKSCTRLPLKGIVSNNKASAGSSTMAMTLGVRRGERVYGSVSRCECGWKGLAVVEAN